MSARLLTGAQLCMRIETEDVEAVRVETYNRLLNVLFSGGIDPARVARRMMMVAQLAEVSAVVPDAIRKLPRYEVAAKMKERVR